MLLLSFIYCRIAEKLPILFEYGIALCYYYAKTKIFLQPYKDILHLDGLVFFAGGGGYRGAPRGGPRGGGSARGGAPRGRGGRQGESLKFEEEFDFESANAQFDKEEIERELKEKLVIGINLSITASLDIYIAVISIF